MTAAIDKSLPASRRCALEVLELTLPTGKSRHIDVQDALAKRLDIMCIDPRDKRLATELVYGYLRLKGRMDFLASSLLAKPAKTHPQVLRILGLALYELTHLDHVPHHATLSWAADAARKRVAPFAAGLVNGVLRAAIRLGDAVHDPSYYRADNPPEDEFLSRFASMPLWITRKLIAGYGLKRAAELLSSQLLPAPTGLRINASRPGAHTLFDRLSALPQTVYSDFPALALSNASQALQEQGLTELEFSGHVTRQSFAVHVALQNLGAKDWPAPLWDACAGRGGKTAYLLENGCTPVISSDLNVKRLHGLQHEMTRLQLDPPLLLRSDAAHPALKPGLSTILVDAPCSGLGVLARRPDAKWKRTPADVTALQATQRSILLACCDLLSPGGLLCYLTCTVLPEENEQQAQWLSSRRSLVEIARTETDISSGLGEFFWGVVFRKN